MKSYFIKSHDGKKLFLATWDNVKEPKGVIQIIHGMNEHIGRYENIARYLNDKGFIVYGDDHRGHGRTAQGTDEVGYIGKDGFCNIVKDEKYITDLIKRKHPNLPNFICGHSFGSFISQEYLNRYSDKVDGVILCGSAFQKGMKIVLGRVISTTQMLFGFEKKPANLITNITSNILNKDDESDNKKSWITWDEKEIEKLNKDKLYNEILTVNFYYYMFKGITDLYKQNKSKNIRKDVPIFIISGKDDSAGDYGDSAKKLESYYKNLGIKNVSLKIYEGKKHELFNELGKEEVYDDLYNWIKDIISSPIGINIH